MSSTWRESHLKLSPSITFRTDKSYHFQTIWFFLRNNTLPHPTHLRLHPSDWIDRHKWFISACAAEIWATGRRFSTTYMLNNKCPTSQCQDEHNIYIAKGTATQAPWTNDYFCTCSRNIRHEAPVFTRFQTTFLIPLMILYRVKTVKTAETTRLHLVRLVQKKQLDVVDLKREPGVLNDPISITFRTDKSYHFQTIWFFLRNNTLQVPHPTHLRLHPSDWTDRHKWFLSTCAAEIWATRRRFSTTYMLNIINVQRVNAEMNIIHCDITWRHSDSSAMNKWLFLHVQQKYQARGADFHSISKHIPHSS